MATGARADATLDDLTRAGKVAGRGEVVGWVVAWAAFSAAVTAIVALPFVLGGLAAIVAGTAGEAMSGAFAAAVAGLVLGLVVRGHVRTIRHLFRWPGYPARHWWFARRAVRSSVITGAGWLAVVAGVLAFAIVGRGPLAEMGVLVAATAAAVYLFCFFGTVAGLGDVLRRACVVPYFPRQVGEIATFARGEYLARHVAELDDLAVVLGVRPVSSFGWNDDFVEGEPLEWHEAADGLETIRALLDELRGGEFGWSDRAEVIDDLERIAHALARADAQDIPFCLLLRHQNVTNAMEWERRKGTCF